MKKFTLCLALICVFTLTVNAQELVSKKGFPILPETGDYGLAIDAVPFFEFLGNMFHGDGFTTAPTWDFPGFGYDIPMWTLQLKKFIDPKTAIRARVRLGFLADTKKNSINDQLSTDLTSFVDDKWTNTKVNVVLGGGIEKRKGKGRVQGYAGAMANIIIATENNKYTYGNSYTSLHTSPQSTNIPWVSDEEGGYIYSGHSSRTLKDNSGLTFGIGANVFIGVEYFFAPKMSIGGEFAWGFLFKTTGKSKIEEEYWDGTNSTARTIEVSRGGSTYFGIDNYNSGGSINLSFYF